MKVNWRKVKVQGNDGFSLVELLGVVDFLQEMQCTSFTVEPTLLFSHFSHVRLCNPRDCCTPGFPVFYHLLEFAQTHVH